MIIGVAIRHKGVTYQLPKPSRHHDVIHHICEKGNGPVGGDSAQGFYAQSDSPDENGTYYWAFMDRKEALAYAYKIGQLQAKDKLGCEGLLFSEDLW